MVENHNTSAGRVPGKALLLIVLICVLMGVNWSVMKGATQYASPMSIAFLRTLIAATLLGFWIRLSRHDTLKPPAGFTGKVLLQSLIFSGHVITMYLGVKYISAGRSAVICYMTPFFAVLFERLFLSIRPGVKQVIGMCIAFAAVLILFADRPGNIPANASYLGDAIMVVSAMFWAGSSVFTKKYLTQHTRPHQTVFWSTSLTCIIACIVASATGELALTQFTWQFVLLLLYQAVLVAFISFTILQALIYRYSAGLIHTFTFLSPIFGVFSGVIFLGEPAGWSMALCLALVCCGLVLVNKK